MSKRKSVAEALQDDDFKFEDQDGMEDGMTETGSIAGDSSVSRAGRSRKTKSIYDPSEHNGPVHKRKKEQLEAERAKMVKSPAKPKPTPTESAKVVSSPAKSTAIAKVVKPSITEAAGRRKTVDIIKKRPALEIKQPTIAERKPAPPAVPSSPSKEPSKRIQERKQAPAAAAPKVSLLPTAPRVRPPSAATTSTDYETASTVELQDRTIPNVSRWTHNQVTDYFCNKLGFSKVDSMIFKEQEIDGETLMIMKRSDIVNSKFENLKLGVALRMWQHISSFQTGSSDPTQTWK